MNRMTQRMALATHQDRKAVADRIREFALLVEAGCVDVVISQTVAHSAIHHQIEIMEPRREVLFDPITITLP